MIPCVNNKITKPRKLAYHANIKASRKSVKIYCHRDRTSISQRTSCNKGYVAGAAIYHQWNIIDPLYVTRVSTLRELVIVSAAIAGLASSFFSFFPFSLFVCFVLSSLPHFHFFFFNFLSCGCISFSLSCLFLLEGKVLQLCSNRNFGHLPVGWVSCLRLGKEPS